MSDKRKNKVLKRQKRNLKKQTKCTNNAVSHSLLGGAIPRDFFGHMPTHKEVHKHFNKVEDVDADFDLVMAAWGQHYGELKEDFVPPFFIEQGNGDLTAAEWIGTYRVLLVERFPSMQPALIEGRIKVVLQMLMSTAYKS